MTARPDRDHREKLPLHEREFLDAGDVARLFGRSRKLINEWDKLGLMPAPMRIKGSVLWRRRELVDWLESNCPVRGDSRNGRPWQWRPGATIKLETYLASLKAECVRLSTEAARVSGLIEQGERLVHVRRGNP